MSLLSKIGGSVVQSSVANDSVLRLVSVVSKAERFIQEHSARGILVSDDRTERDD